MIKKVVQLCIFYGRMQNIQSRAGEGNRMQTRLELQSKATALLGGWRIPLTGAERAAIDWALVDDHLAVLDLSCADGRLLRYYTQRYQLRACGVCYDAQQAQQTRDSLQSSEIMYTASTDIPWQDESFDRVLLTGILPAFGHPLELLKETCRVLRPGGILLVVFSSLPFQKSLKLPFFGGGKEISLSRRQLLESLEVRGFEDVSLRQSRVVYTTLIAHKSK
jgi:cyclopropane fatty-acyl-phospholipid synthase-like methyltransferase